MTVLTGKDFYLEFNGVAVTGIYRKFDDGMEQESAEATSGTDAVRNYVSTLIKIEPKATVVLNDASSALAQLKMGTTGTLIWGPQGNGAGKPKWGVAARVKAAPVSRTYDAEVEIEVTWEVTSGTLTYDGRTDVF